MRGAHVCMSGNLECSGVDPCAPCASAVLTFVLVPAMKAAGIDKRNDPRVAAFLQTYAEACRKMVAGFIAQAAQAAARAPLAPQPMVPPPSVPPMADVPLTEAELEAMAVPVSVPPLDEPPPAMAGGPEEVTPDESMTDIPVPPAGLMSDEEFKERFPTIPPESVMEVPWVSKSHVTNCECVFAGHASKADPRCIALHDVADPRCIALHDATKPKASPPTPEEPSLLKLASQALSPTLPAALPAREASEVGSAPTEPAPSPEAPKAPSVDASAVSESASSPADTITFISTSAVS